MQIIRLNSDFYWPPLPTAGASDLASNADNVHLINVCIIIIIIIIEHVYSS